MAVSRLQEPDAKTRRCRREGRNRVERQTRGLPSNDRILPCFLAADSPDPLRPGFVGLSVGTLAERFRLNAMNAHANIERSFFGSTVLYSQRFPMARQLNTEEARQNLSAQVATQGAAIHSRYGPEIDWNKLMQLLEDRSCVRYPCEIRFDSAPLLPGEFAHPVPRGSEPAEGYIIYVHPAYETQLGRVSYLVLHQLVWINYGASAQAEDAEAFGAVALGLSKEEYFSALCELAGQLGGDDLV
jgi:hypothetical protein